MPAFRQLVRNGAVWTSLRFQCLHTSASLRMYGHLLLRCFCQSHSHHRPYEASAAALCRQLRPDRGCCVRRLHYVLLHGLLAAVSLLSGMSSSWTRKQISKSCVLVLIRVLVFVDALPSSACARQYCVSRHNALHGRSTGLHQVARLGRYSQQMAFASNCLVRSPSCDPWVMI